MKTKLSDSELLAATMVYRLSPQKPPARFVCRMCREEALRWGCDAPSYRTILAFTKIPVPTLRTMALRGPFSAHRQARLA
jgi:hypothetical protein